MNFPKKRIMAYLIVVGRCSLKDKFSLVAHMDPTDA